MLHLQLIEGLEEDPDTEEDDDAEADITAEAELVAATDVADDDAGSVQMDVHAEVWTASSATSIERCSRDLRAATDVKSMAPRAKADDFRMLDRAMRDAEGQLHKASRRRAIEVQTRNGSRQMSDSLERERLSGSFIGLSSQGPRS